MKQQVVKGLSYTDTGNKLSIFTAVFVLSETCLNMGQFHCANSFHTFSSSEPSLCLKLRQFLLLSVHTLNPLPSFRVCDFH